MYPPGKQFPPISALALLLAAAASPAAGETLILPPEDVDLVGVAGVVETEYEDTLPDVGRRFGLGYHDMVRANPGVDVWLPGAGTRIVLATRFILPPGPRKGIVLNLPEYRLYYYPEPEKGKLAVVETYPISIGRMDWSTPLGTTRIVTKVRNPSWYPPESVREEYAAEGTPLPVVVPPGPENPLGAHAMRLALPGYLIHGTNKPKGVGMRVSHGCIRMYPEDIAQIFARVPLNTPVRIINEPYKIGWMADTLFLEAHPVLTEDDARAARDLTNLTTLLVGATRSRKVPVDWEEAAQIFRQARGIPLPMSVPGAEVISVAER